MRKFTTPLLAVAAVALASGCASTPAPLSIAETTARTPELSTLSRLLADSGLNETLRGAGPYTVFAPTDAAFKALPAKTLADLGNDKERLKAVLGYHVVQARLPSVDVKNGNIKTVTGASVAISRAGTFVTFDDAIVTRADIGATNGVVHLIDKVIVPPAPRR